MTLTSSSANVSSMTRWIVTLSSASKSVYGTFVLSDGTEIRCRGGCSLSCVRVDKRDDVLHRRAWQEDAPDADFFQLRDVHVRNDPADDDQHVVQPLLFEQLHQPRHDVIVRAR